MTTRHALDRRTGMERITVCVRASSGGMLKTKPDSWKDVFFPYVYEKGGS